MLDRAKLLKEFSAISSKLFPEKSCELKLAKDIWQKISQDELFQSRSIAAQSSFLIPGWMGKLSDSFDVAFDLKKYSVIAVDGSQIYPDRNMPGSGCFLINIGGVLLEYGDKGKANFFSDPFIFMIEDFIADQSAGAFSMDFVDLRREEFEFKFALAKSIENNFGNISDNKVCLVDGTLVFWHLEGKSTETRKTFLDVYLSYLDQFYQNKILIAGYISSPKSKELVNLIKLGLCRFPIADCITCHKVYTAFPCRQVDSLLDSHVVRFFLGENQRTTLFWSNSKIVEDYPPHLKPYFFYLDVGVEIVRIEIPAWIAENDEYVNTICRVALDQTKKGRGYPVCLAEAHEQAVVKGPDRDFFYHLICKVGLENKKQILFSQKSLKKKGIRI